MNQDDLNDDDLDFEEEAKPSLNTNEMTINELYEYVILQSSVILTVTHRDATAIRAGITSIKGKENSKLRRQGLPIASSRLEFANLPCDKEGFTRLQISLIDRKTFSIVEIEQAGDL